MRIKPILTPSGQVMFRLRRGQIFVALVMIFTILSLIVLSFSAAEVRSENQAELLAEESDSAAVVFVQREAFGYVLTLQEYLMGDATRDEVVISRASLSKRLNVITSSGQSSLELSGESFRSSLSELDSAFSDYSPNSGSTSALMTKASEFLSETRPLTGVFQEMSNNYTSASIQRERTFDIIQGLLSLIALSLGLWLFIWVVRDVLKGFGRAFSELELQNTELTNAREEFIAVQRLEEQIGEWSTRLKGGESPNKLITEIDLSLGEFKQKGSIALNDNGELQFSEPIPSSQSTELTTLIQGRLQGLIDVIRLQSKTDKQILWERSHCRLTGLLNRKGFREQLARLMSSEDLPLLLVDVDVDKFSAYNSSMGIERGDEVLKKFANCFKSLELPGAKVARVGPDEFSLAVPANRAKALDIIQRLDTHFQNISSDGHDERVTASMGWYLITTNEPPENASAKSHSALKSARLTEVPGSIREFVPEQDERLLHEYRDQLKFNAALNSGEIVPYFQPIVSLESSQAIGFEALVRWESPTQGTLNPVDFLGTASSAGLMDEVFDLVLEKSLEKWSGFNTSSEPRPYVSVNVDPKTLRRSDFAAKVLFALRIHGVRPTSLVLEVTEESLLLDARLDQLESLRTSGVRIALDDFGIGYSNLGRLNELPIDILKIDRSLLANLTTDQKPRDTLASIKSLGQKAGHTVVVEGVETLELAEILKQIGFRFAQGYLYSKALPTEELTSWLTSELA